MITRALDAILAVDSGKVTFWLSELDTLVASGRVDSQEARRLAGRLSFGCSAVWGRLPRGRLSRLFQAAHGSKVDPTRLRADLRWWLSFLAVSNSTTVSLSLSSEPWSLLYTDAAGSGGGGAVLLQGSEALWFSVHVACITPLLHNRKTQINAFELFVVFAALEAFRDQLRGSRLAIMIDNSVALWSLCNGASTASDISAIAHAAWVLAGSLGLELHSYWVPSKLNLADAPSRGSRPQVGSQYSHGLDLAELASRVEWR